ncbi:MAG: hypothetical protein MJ138_06700, partial [Kiritimatiellae bacterium]|nr:hypothetical protein [Kiritimatiellia bacterium]
MNAKTRFHGRRLSAPLAAVAVCGVVAAAVPLRGEPARTLTVESEVLYLPIDNGAPKLKLLRSSPGADLPPLDVQLAPAAKAGWWAPMDVSELRGRELTFSLPGLPADKTNLLAGISAAAPEPRPRASEM